MTIDFAKLNDPNWKKQWADERKERERQLEEQETLRKKTVCFTGHRPNKLGGYDMKNPTMLKLKDKLLEVIEELIIKEEKSRFITGGALGTDQAACWCVHIIKKKYPHIKNIIATPFKEQDKVWSADQKMWYKRMLDVADEIINVEELDKYKVSGDKPGEFSPAKMQKRNEYMIDHSEAIVAVYDGTKSGTRNCLNYAKKTYLGHQLWRLHPNINFELDITYLN
ncbi:SLOG family protein [Bacillus halotolerans]|uniref:SLOG family protein n=1 Tax=Bacillus halotolerans TaxID=260554 RepID=UPI002573B051|nr:SLOG family protein [Bacillus halotolerans]MDL5612196.1 SLOG family protein [Bacillus halotolerans]